MSLPFTRAAHGCEELVLAPTSAWRHAAAVALAGRWVLVASVICFLPTRAAIEAGGMVNNGWVPLARVAEWIRPYSPYYYAYGIILILTGGPVSLFFRIFRGGHEYNVRRYANRWTFAAAFFPATPILAAGFAIGVWWALFLGIAVVLGWGYWSSGQGRRDEFRRDIRIAVREAVRR